VNSFPTPLEDFEYMRQRERAAKRHSLALRLSREAGRHRKLGRQQIEARLRLHTEQAQILREMMPWRLRQELNRELATALANIPASLQRQRLILQLLTVRLKNEKPFEEIFALRDHPQMYAFGEIRRILAYWDLEYHQANIQRISQFLPLVRSR